jgi:hypothetical protein
MRGRLPSLFWAFCALLTVAGTLRVPAQMIVRYPDSTRSLAPEQPALAVRWQGALEEAKRRGFSKGYWIGYSIERLMAENSFIGSYYSDTRRNKPSLGELLTGREQLDVSPRSSSGNFTVNEGYTTEGNLDSRRPKVMKEIGVLFHFAAAGKTDEMKVTNLSLHVDLEGDPLIWMGGADDRESIAFLKSRFEGSQSSGVKEHTVEAIGLHKSSAAVLSFLRDVLAGSETGNVREEAAFWLGQMDTDEALKVLVEAAETDRSENVRENAIYGISQMEGDRGVDALIALTRKHSDKRVREKAAFWLGQKASEKAVTTLNDLAFSSDDTDVQKSALYALTQLPDGSGVEYIIKIATTHPNPKVRKEAVYWLGQCDDDRAIETLIKIVRP